MTQQHHLCIRCGTRLQSHGVHCPGCGLPVRGGSWVGALVAPVLAGASMAVAGTVLSSLAGALSPPEFDASPMWWALLAPSLAVASVLDLLLVVAGGAVPALLFRRIGGAARVGAALSVGLLAGVVAASAGEGLGRVALVIVLGVAGGTCAPRLLSWAARRAPFGLLASRLDGAPWPARAIALVPAVTVSVTLLPWLVVVSLVLSAVGEAAASRRALRSLSPEPDGAGGDR